MSWTLLKTTCNLSLTNFTVFPSKPIRTHTSVAPGLLFTGASVAAGTRSTGIVSNWKETRKRESLKWMEMCVFCSCSFFFSSSYSTFLAVLPPVSVLALTGVAFILFVTVASIQTGRRVADWSGLYWKTHTKTWLCSITPVDRLNTLNHATFGKVWEFLFSKNTKTAQVQCVYCHYIHYNKHEISDFVFSWLGAWRSYHWGRSPYDRFPFQPFDMYTGRFRRTPNKDRHQDTAYCGCMVSALLLGERGWDVAQTNCSFFTTFHRVICAHAAQHQPAVRGHVFTKQKGAQMYSLRSHHDSSEPIHNSECTPHLFFLLYCTTLTYFSATP